MNQSYICQLLVLICIFLEFVKFLIKVNFFERCFIIQLGCDVDDFTHCSDRTSRNTFGKVRVVWMCVCVCVYVRIISLFSMIPLKFLSTQQDKHYFDLIIISY